MTTGKGFTRLTTRRGNIFQAVLQIVEVSVARISRANWRSFRPGWRAVMLQRLIHRRLERAVWQVAGAGFIKRHSTVVSVIIAAPWAIFSMRS
jgi:hypothetical protein